MPCTLRKAISHPKDVLRPRLGTTGLELLMTILRKYSRYYFRNFNNHLSKNVSPLRQTPPYGRGARRVILGLILGTLILRCELNQIGPQ